MWTDAVPDLYGSIFCRAISQGKGRERQLEAVAAAADSLPTPPVPDDNRRPSRMKHLRRDRPMRRLTVACGWMDAARTFICTLTCSKTVVPDWCLTKPNSKVLLTHFGESMHHGRRDHTPLEARRPASSLRHLCFC